MVALYLLWQAAHERREYDETVRGQVDVIEERLAVTVPALRHRARPVVHDAPPALDRILAERRVDKAHSRLVLALQSRRRGWESDVVARSAPSDDLVESELRIEVGRASR